MEKFEYKLFYIDTTISNTLEESLNDLGNKGWEMICKSFTEINTFNNQQLIIFKRKIDIENKNIFENIIKEIETERDCLKNQPDKLYFSELNLKGYNDCIHDLKCILKDKNLI